MKKTLIAAFCIIGVAATAASVSAKPRGADRFEKLDADGDGIVTAAEMDARRADFINDADANGDGGVSEDEFRAHRQARRAERRAKKNPDTNGDGLVDRSEFLAAAEKRFDRLDKDGDGVIREDERRSRRGRHHRGDRGE